MYNLFDCHLLRTQKTIYSIHNKSLKLRFHGSKYYGNVHTNFPSNHHNISVYFRFFVYFAKFAVSLSNLSMAHTTEKKAKTTEKREFA